MTDVNKWIQEYEELIRDESIQYDGYPMSDEDKERLKTMRFQLTARLWGSKLT